MPGFLGHWEVFDVVDTGDGLVLFFSRSFGAALTCLPFRLTPCMHSFMRSCQQRASWQNPRVLWQSTAWKVMSQRPWQHAWQWHGVQMGFQEACTSSEALNSFPERALCAMLAEGIFADIGARLWSWTAEEVLAIRSLVAQSLARSIMVVPVLARLRLSR